MGRGSRISVVHASAGDIRDLLRNRGGATASGNAPSWATPGAAGAQPGAPADPVSLRTDDDMLSAATRVEIAPNGIAFRGATGVNVLAESADHEASPTGKRFRGYVGVREGADTRIEFIGITCYGPANNPTRAGSVEATGRNLDAVINAVNEKLETKRRGRGSSLYEAIRGTGPEWIDRTMVQQAIRARVDR